MFISGSAFTSASIPLSLPGSTTAYSNTRQRLNYTRVWYGHGQRVNSDGTDGGGLGGATPNLYSPISGYSAAKHRCCCSGVPAGR